MCVYTYTYTYIMYHRYVIIHNVVQGDRERERER